MIYNNIEKGIFLERPNRFIAIVDINGTIETVHVKNTGRCKELLIKGVTVYLDRSDNPNRKTRYDLIGVVKGDVLINIDSQAPNNAVDEWLKKGDLFSLDAKIKREVTYGNSRFDFYIEDGERKIFLEVKGVTLERQHIAYFPDAPTERGVKHIDELIKCVEDGYEGYIFFVIQMKGIDSFMTNDTMHSEFGKTLRKAIKSGVGVIVMDCIITKDSMIIDKNVEMMVEDGDN